MSVLLVGCQQGVHMYIAAVLLPYKIVVSMQKSIGPRPHRHTVYKNFGGKATSAGCVNTAEY